MSILTKISNYASDLRLRRQRARTYMMVTSLPRDIQKDIGWPDAHDDVRAARRPYR